MNEFLDQLGRWLDGLFGQRRRRPVRESPRSPLSGVFTEFDRVIPHECGHASLAWLSPAVLYVDGITFHHSGGASTNVAFNPNHSDYHLEDLVYTLGGLIGEMAVWKKIHTGGMAANEQSDLPIALKLAGTVIERMAPERIERLWRGRLAAPSLDIASMFARRPHRDIAAALNLAYRRGKYLLNENRAGFERLCIRAAGRRNLSRQDIASQFGPRVWAPGGR